MGILNSPASENKKPRGRVPRGFECLLLGGFYSNASNGTGAGAVKVRKKVEAQTAFHLAGRIAHIGARSQAFRVGSLHKSPPRFLG
jgi:hypothetical protein